MDKSSYPSFTIILKTENLVTATREDFRKALSSLMNQDLSLELAEELIVINDGNIPDSIQIEIATSYPWIKICQTPESLGYYGVKSYGVKLATGEIVVYGDADCQYSPSWLRSLLDPFRLNQQVEIVAGETVIDVKGPYSMAIALNYILHRQPVKPGLNVAPFYYMNNVAFKREILLKYPIPEGLPIFRGNCSIRSRILRKNGYTIWKQPLARAVHAVPNSLQNYLWRFLLMGHDHHWLDILYHEVKINKQLPSVASVESTIREKLTPNHSPAKFKSKPLHKRLLEKSGYILNQARIYLKESPDKIVYLPLALPIVFLSQFLILVGRLMSKNHSHYLLKVYLEKFEPAYAQSVQFQTLLSNNKD